MVYPTDKFQAISQTFHKLCFKCTECSVVLNLKTYQSHNKKPYCKAHLPKDKARPVADTMESQRLKNVSSMVSNVQYRAEFEKMKGDAGTFSQAGLDAPQLKMMMRNSQQQSQVKYNQAQNEHTSYVPTPVSTRGIAVIPGIAPVAAAAAPARVEPEVSAGVDASVMQDSVAVVKQAVPQEASFTVQEAPVVVIPDQGTGTTYKALYDYQPDAEDELKFHVGDIIVDAQVVSEGWCFGTNQKTGQAGLFPEPYCTKA
ncbi:hypothetical protein MP638_004975 [Amoeboaphelidium occidentale]|nr:hypothetical protein MP638_004975 [Amoeboaphelidium occidentale]